MTASPQVPEVLERLARAHRDAQADHRAALAADHARDLDTARRRLSALEARLRGLGHPQLADQLTDEARAGTALIVALTCPDQPADQLSHAMSTFAQNRAGVDATYTRVPTHPQPDVPLTA